MCISVCACLCVPVCLSTTLQGYLKAVKRGDDVVPVKIRERPEEVFGNVEDIFSLHSKYGLKWLAGSDTQCVHVFEHAAGSKCIDPSRPGYGNTSVGPVYSGHCVRQPPALSSQLLRQVTS